MAIISYAQNFEDVMLWRALGHIQNGFYIDIGAHDPVVDSVSKLFYDNGWRGVSVEALPNCAETIRKERLDEIVVSAAVSNKRGMLKFYDIFNGGISTGSITVMKSHSKKGFSANPIYVNTLTMDDVFELADNKDIHWLKIDVEGMEAEVLSSWINSSARPWIVVVESTLPLSKVKSHKKWEKYLLAKQYRYCYFDGLNRFYVADERHDELRWAFDSPPNVFDDFMLDGSSSAGFSKKLNDEKNRLILDLKDGEIRYSELHKELDDRNVVLESKIKSLTTDLQALSNQLQLHEESLVRKLDEVSAGNLLEKQRIAAGHSEQKMKLCEEIIALQSDILAVEKQWVAKFEAFLKLTSERESALQSDLLSLGQQSQLREQQAALRFSDLQASHASALRDLQSIHTDREQGLEQKIQALLSELRELERLWQSKSDAWREEARTQQESTQKELLGLIHELQLREQHFTQKNEEDRLNSQRRLLDSLRHTEKIEVELAKIKSTFGWRLLKRFMSEPQDAVLDVCAIDASDALDFNHELKPHLSSVAIMQNEIFYQNNPEPKTLAELLKCSGILFVNYAFKSILHRTPDESGRQTYLSMLKSGKSKIDILASIYFSSEASAKRKNFGLSIAQINMLQEAENSSFLIQAYQLLLNREPDELGFSYYSGRLNAGEKRSAIIKKIANSQEAKKNEIDLSCLYKRYYLQKILQLPIVGNILKLFSIQEDGISIEQRLRALDEKITAYANFNASIFEKQKNEQTEEAVKSMSTLDAQIPHADIANGNGVYELAIRLDLLEKNNEKLTVFISEQMPSILKEISELRHIQNGLNHDDLKNMMCSIPVALRAIQRQVMELTVDSRNAN